MRPLAFLFAFSIMSASAQEGSFINPITDVCWECMFPMTVSGVNVTPKQKEFDKGNKRICVCESVPPRIGVPLSFWEPMHLVDVTRHAYKLIGMGGVSVGKETIKNRGSVGRNNISGTKHSFYHVHYYSFPVFKMLEILTDFICVDEREFDVPYMSELDPTWGDENLSAVINAEAMIFANHAAQLACVSDCATSSVNAPSDALFWCAGCEGSLYPFTGAVSHHVGGIQAGSLLLQRTMAKMHRTGFVKGFSKDNFCEAEYMPIMRKTLYKTQLAYPIPQTKGPCHAMGKSDLLWGTGKSYPINGEDFVYIVWSKKQCCLDAVKPALTGGAQ